MLLSAMLNPRLEIELQSVTKNVDSSENRVSRKFRGGQSLSYRTSLFTQVNLIILTLFHNKNLLNIILLLCCIYVGS